MDFHNMNTFLTKRNSDNKEIGYHLSASSWLKILICTFLYVVTMILQTRMKSVNNFGGIIAQTQVMISIYLVVSVKKYGYLIAVVINIIECMMVARVYFILGVESAAQGIIVALCTIVILSVIESYGKNLKYKLKEVTDQKEELSRLYEEIAASEEEIREQNFKLVEYNKMMEEKEDKLNYLAFIDILTELPNRKMIINRLDLLVRLSMKKQESFAVVFIDLDNFKRINDSKGHHIGDLLLQAAAIRLLKLIHEEDMLGRIGGDEFALIIQRRLKESEIFEYVERLRTVLIKCFSIKNSKFYISASFGISIYPQDGLDSTDLLKSADTAMYKAKDCGKNSVQFFNKEMRDEIFKKMEFENRLLSSLSKEELYLVYQPQYNATTKELRGFEALARWQSPELGFVSPVEFIPVAEETGYINPMGKWILTTACNMIKDLQSNYQMDLVISVNTSSVQIIEPSFVQMVKSVLNETKVNGRHLELEITESVFISSVDYVIGVFDELKKMGIRIALDDFGTGYSSLCYLQKLPIDTLKIDKSFINSINSVNSSKQIVGSIISLVHKMDITVVAEGVEKEQQLEYLVEQQCDIIQGYLWGKPLEKNELNQLLQQVCYEVKG